MKLTVLRSLPLVLVLDVVLLLVSGIPRFKNGKHGFDLVFGEIVWLGFLVGAFAVLVLAAIAVSRAVSRRAAQA